LLLIEFLLKDCWIPFLEQFINPWATPSAVTATPGWGLLQQGMVLCSLRNHEIIKDGAPLKSGGHHPKSYGMEGLRALSLISDLTKSCEVHKFMRPLFNPDWV
jgi:hypothetical protein